ncbi:FixH family protein [Vibrio hannami]|uniref:FixH family protein n=1 Tax=Vibrio hannami TaxID=2717094 RepID=UPI00240ED017|nr:FixH family protein [Vibrio hannami]MDG3088138.1 FixH family protein [Vibrio hannami]
MVKPWYKQFWPWFLIALPLCVVIASLTTFAIFSKNSVNLVAEDYYKKGKAISVDLSRVNAANGLKIKASVHTEENQIVIDFDKGELNHHPALNVIFTHRTLPNQDFQVLLSSDANGVYRHTLDKALTGPWFVELEPHTREWLVQGKVTFPSSSPTALSN